ncbi:unnamed protein product [Effrenium voratum]|nr:unnamed protein product [Effrenium voratum]
MWQLVTSVLPRCRGARARALLPRVARRSIRTGFFPDDEDFIDPEGPVLADHINGRWRHMDDPTLRANILERSNVGMGMLVINRASGFDLSSVNDLYRRLRDLEVNSLKRFVGLAAMDKECTRARVLARALCVTKECEKALDQVDDRAAWTTRGAWMT